jgi:hypothetical protein
MSLRSRKSWLRRNWFPLAISVIAAVSLYDTFLIVRFSEVIVTTEENPIGKWLLKVGDGSVGIFVRIKLAGTIVVLSSLLGMWLCRSRMVFPVTTSVASYQAGLFMYLTVA